LTWEDNAPTARHHVELGYACYSRAYYAPAAERKTSQARRAAERRKSKKGKSKRRERGGTFLIKHMRKRYADLDDDHLIWSKLKYIADQCDNMKYGEYKRKDFSLGQAL